MSIEVENEARKPFRALKKTGKIGKKQKNRRKTRILPYFFLTIPRNHGKMTR